MMEMRKTQQVGIPNALVRTTPVPNWILDELMPHLSDTELRVLLVVVRSTLGWQDGKSRKERDWISHRQLQARTGRSSAVVSRAIDGLVKRGVLGVTNAAEEMLDTAKLRSQARGQLYFRVQVPGKLRALPSLNLFSNINKGLLKPKLFIAPSASKNEASGDQSTFNTLPRKLRATKETGTKEIKNIGGRVITLPVPTLKNEVSRLTQGEIQSLVSVESEAEMGTLKNVHGERGEGRDEPDLSPFEFEGGREGRLELSAEVRRFLNSFNEAYKMARLGKEPPPFGPETSALLGRRLEQYSLEQLEAWLPSFFDCTFGYVRRRNWSLESYLESFQLLQAKGSSIKQREHRDTMFGAT